MCECKNQRPTGKQTADKIWGNGRTSQATDSWPPVSGKPKPFTDAETVALTRVIKDSIAELRRKRKPKPALSPVQVAAIRQIVQDAVKPPARESYRIGADSGRYAERITKIRTDNPRLHGEVIEIGGMKCQLINGRMSCK